VPRRWAYSALVPRHSALARGSAPDAWPLTDVLLPFAVSRLFLAAAGLFARYTMPAAPGWAGGGGWQASTHAWINAWADWDSRWYVGIVEDGYTFQPGGESSVAFWPGLPLLMKLGSLLLRRGDSEAIAAVGILISNVALLAAVFFLVRLGREEMDPASAARAAFYLLVFPTTLFLSSVYPHALFLALAVASTYYARHGAGWRAGGLAAMATLTRPYGALLLVPLAWELAASRPPVERARWAPLALVPAALLAWVAFQAWRFGDPLAFLEAQRAWNRAPSAPWHILDPYIQGRAVLYGFADTWLDLAFALGYAAAIVAAWRCLRPSYALLATLLFLVPLATGSTQSMTRLGLELFPMFLVLGLAGRQRWFHQAYAVASIGFATLLALMFALHYWVA
jgi:Mannosyltransferase (PIG-V)